MDHPRSPVLLSLLFVVACSVARTVPEPAPPDPPALPHSGASSSEVTLAAPAPAEPAPGPFDEAPIAPDVLRSAVERVLPLLQSSMETWYEGASCFSCHHQGLGTMAVAMARERGVAVDEARAARMLARILEPMPGPALEGAGFINGTFGRGYQLLALAAEQTPRDGRTEAVAHYLAGNAVPRGPQGEQAVWLSDSFRPPLEASAVTGTALALRGIDVYHAEGRAADVREMVARGRAWLEQLQPDDAEQRAMRLLGLGWSGASAQRLRAAADDIAREQRSDGGWAQLATSKSDVYATGQALVVLAQWGGLSPDSPAYQRGLGFLLERQFDDGSWMVETRRRAPGLDYFETGFPHRMNQFLSTAASAWAVMALCCALDPGPSVVFHGPRPPLRAEPFDLGLDAVQRAAAFGTPAELAAALESGGDADAPGPRGLRALHLAVHDPRKLELLLERGASLEVGTDRGATPLMLAAWYGVDDSAAGLLLDRGADPNARAQADGMTPLLRAVRSGKLGLVRRLVAAGASPDAAAADGETALHLATTAGDAPMAALLLELGAEVDARCDSCTPLLWAAHDGEDGLVRLLLAHGADPDAVDDDGMTALAWAAKVEHGHGRVLAALLAAGADPGLASSAGRTPLDWARRFDNELAIAALEPLADAR